MAKSIDNWTGDQPQGQDGAAAVPAVQQSELPPLPAFTCDATTGHVCVRKDEDLLAWGRACIAADREKRAQVAAPVAPLKRLQRLDAALRMLDERLRECSKHPITAAEAYDSFYQAEVSEALDGSPLYAGAPPVAQVLSDERIDHLWDIHVGEPMPKYPLTAKDWRNFARAVLAAAGIQQEQT